MYRLLFKILLIMFVINTNSAAQTDLADSLISINPKSSYFRLYNDSGALNAIAINLAALGLKELDYIILQQKGDYDNGPNADTFTGMTAVFSTNDSLLDPNLLNRVPGAIEAGEEYITPNTYYGNYTTDIPEDFFVDSIVIQIPGSAEYLFVSPHDSWFNDNSDPDGDFGVRIVKTEVNSLNAFSVNRSPAYELNQNYPNPFNPSTTIEFTLPKSEFVELKVYNILGIELSTLASTKLNQGKYTYEFDGSSLSSGIYFYKLTTERYQETKKMILMK